MASTKKIGAKPKTRSAKDIAERRRSDSDGCRVISPAPSSKSSSKPSSKKGK